MSFLKYMARRSWHTPVLLPVIITVAALSSPLGAQEEEADPAEIAIGERVFLETRFAQFFAVNRSGGDPVMKLIETTGTPLPGPFADQSMRRSSTCATRIIRGRNGASHACCADRWSRVGVTPAMDSGVAHARHS
jgi:hypothetical protein